MPPEDFFLLVAFFAAGLAAFLAAGFLAAGFFSAGFAADFFGAASFLPPESSFAHSSSFARRMFFPPSTLNQPLFSSILGFLPSAASNAAENSLRTFSLSSLLIDYFLCVNI
ncbi:hypothetical protein EYQ95_02605 [Lysobacter sp. N42]|nr:hypothetical protein DQX04_02700 [Aliidiomarina sp. B3213]TCZ92899.1 hypothetical protein EYQ95_02605 [Lysobacter sp. N42]